MKLTLPPPIQAFVLRRLNAGYIQSICRIIIAVNAILIAISFITTENGRTIFGPYLGADFASFYAAGLVFHEHGAASIYDRELHTLFYRTLFPDLSPNVQLPYANAPFFIIPFIFLAKLPYSWAYFTWLLIGIGAYAGGLVLIERTLDGTPVQVRHTMFWAALSFMPFLTENLAGGQVATVGFLCLAAALYFLRMGRPVLSGMMLAVCLYKPTLLILILPMLLITKRFIVLRGFFYGCAGLAAISLLVVGWEGCIRYVNMLVFFIDASSVTAESGLRTWKYVDMNSFFRLLVGSNLFIRWTLVLTSAMVILPILVRSWLQIGSERGTRQGLVWALAITWTLILNLYVGIYDSILIIISIFLIIEYLYVHIDETQRWRGPVVYVVAALFITPWVTQTVALMTHVQIYTIVLAIFGGYQIILSKSVQQSKARQPAAEQAI